MSQWQLSNSQLQLLKQILTQHGLKPHIFGSRAKGSARPLSDIDLCILHPVEKSQITQARLAFEDSNLPMKVDLVLWSELPKEFQDNIQKDLVPIIF